MPTKKVNLSGLTCPACKKLAEKRIVTIPGTKRVEVNLKSGETIIDSDTKIQLQQIKEALKDTPYQVTE